MDDLACKQTSQMLDRCDNLTISFSLSDQTQSGALFLESIHETVTTVNE